MTWRVAKPSDEPPLTVAHSLTRVLNGLGAEAPALVALSRQWESVCGPALVGHSVPLRLEGGVLLVGVDHATRATQVRYLEQELLERAAVVVGSGRVHSVRVVLRS